MMKTNMPRLKLQHSVILLILVVLSSHFTIVAQQRGNKNEKTFFPSSGCVITGPRRARVAESTSALKAAPLSCGELSNRSNPEPGEGPTDYTLYDRPEGQVSSVMIFVEFPNELHDPQSEKPSDLYDLLVRDSVNWFAEASYNRLSIAVTLIDKWFPMPQDSAQYKITSDLRDTNTHKAYIAAAIKAGARAMTNWPTGNDPLPGAILPANRIVAYYGNPHSKKMGVIGEYPEQQMLGMLDKTVVMVSSEFGRSPKINKDAGRDHWPRVFSVVFAGGGFKRGYIHGASDPTGSEPDSDPLTVENMAATVFTQLGIKPDKKLMSPGGRPQAIVRDGQVVSELLA